MGKDDGKAFWIVVAIALGVVILYFLSKMAYVFGIVGLFIGFVLLILGIIAKSEKLAIVSIITIVVALGLIFIGKFGINFFEENEVGSGLLNSSEDIVDAGAQVANVVADVYETVDQVEKTTNQALEQSLTS